MALHCTTCGPAPTFFEDSDALLVEVYRELATRPVDYLERRSVVVLVCTLLAMILAPILAGAFAK